MFVMAVGRNMFVGSLTSIDFNSHQYVGYHDVDRGVVIFLLHINIFTLGFVARTKSNHRIAGCTFFRLIFGIIGQI